MYRFLLFMVCGLLFSMPLFAQRTIAGKVTDCEGAPLPGATIIIKGTYLGTAADENGLFKLDLPLDKRYLVFSYAGSLSQEIEVLDQDSINVVMKEDTINNQEGIEVNGPPINRRTSVDKPVIYLYPEKQTDISLQVNFNGKLDFTYPPYKNGWQVTARPDGRLIDKNDGREHQYLFWDGKMSFAQEQITYTTGFVVYTDSLVAFFQKYLPKMGLKPHEYNDFIVFWTPLMQKNEWNFIHFRTGTAYDIISRNIVIPKPDTEIRVFMEFTKAAKPFDIPAQELSTPGRKGFTLVEWGGAELEVARFTVPHTTIKKECPEIEVAPTRCIGPGKTFNPEKI